MDDVFKPENAKSSNESVKVSGKNGFRSQIDKPKTPIHLANNYFWILMTSLAGIILIDDNHTTNFLNTKIIGKWRDSVEVLAFSEPALALETLDHSKKNFLVFIDLNMPGMNGWELVSGLVEKEFNKNNGLVILTSSIDQNDRDRAEANEAILGFFSKPLTFEVLTELEEKYF